MPTETLLTIIGLALSNLVALIAGLIRITTRLTKIETNLQWVIKGCDRCKEDK